MKQFVEAAFPAFQSNRGSYGLSEGVLDTYADAKSEHEFIVSNGLKLAVVMETLAHANLRAKHLERYETIVPQDAFQTYLQDLEDTIEGYLISRDMKPKTARRISKRAKELNNAPFKDILAQLFKSVDLRTVKGDADLFADCRNSLAHAGRFLSTTRPPDKRCPFAQGWAGNKQEYFFMQSLVDRVVLRLLDYDGPYLDCRVRWEDMEAQRPPIPREHVNDLGADE
jgi:hypothetical protein